MENLDNIKEGDFVIIKSKLEGSKSPNFRIYTGIVSHNDNNLLGFAKASTMHIFVGGRTYDSKGTHFSIDKSYIAEVTIL